MSIFLFIILVIYLFSLTFSMFCNNEKVVEVCSEIMKCSVIALFTIWICSIITISTPQAIDVYRNKTTLKITYQDSVPVDSVVVFK